MAVAIAAEDAAMARARAELDALRVGLLGDQAAGAAEATLSPEAVAALATAAELEPELVRLVPVYELRVPVTEAEQAEEASISRAHSLLRSPGEQLLHQHQAEQVHPANFLLYRSVTVVHAGGGHAVHDPLNLACLDPSTLCPDCGPVAGYLRHTPLGVDLHKHQNGHPPEVCHGDQLKSSSVQAVDNGPAAPGSDQGQVQVAGNGPDSPAAGLTGPGEGRCPKNRQSEAVRAAEWLLRSRLDPRLCDDVSVRWLAGVIRGSKLLSQHEWSWEDLADLLHGVPEFTNLPYFIRHCRKWIRARIRRAIPNLSPSKLKVIRDIERDSSAFQQRRQVEAGQARLAEIAARRAAINACGFCDENGMLDLGNDAPVARCNHDPDTRGW
ncbi:hypothetical protein F0L68_41220 [Solihabitans fulvus]|uniref:Uncharacterized protein n=2 Tax=Solihabitans fulvus TaxID=1892852 RepID=A0A5B2W571_9PSEU|nr:hypothetical protein F0L68_41220 [Solihabitans fulvus]